MKQKVSSTKLYQLLRWQFQVEINVLSSLTIIIRAKIDSKGDAIAMPSTSLYIKLLYVNWTSLVKGRISSFNTI